MIIIIDSFTKNNNNDNTRAAHDCYTLNDLIYSFFVEAPILIC